MISRRALGAALLLAASIGPACGNRDLFVVDLVNNPASLDPQVQWDPDSYFVYRNVFDNLVTRDREGKIVPQVATTWSYQSDTEIIFTLREDIRFEMAACSHRTTWSSPSSASPIRRSRALSSASSIPSMARRRSAPTKCV